MTSKLTTGARINAVAPIRICDIGGWTDTWFSGSGAIFNIAVYPYVEVQITLAERKDDARYRISLENYGDAYSFDPEAEKFDKHPLIEAAIQLMNIREEHCLRVNIYSDAPPGASTGTSAAVSVALLGALDALRPGRLTANEVARLAHYVETEKLGLQCGIQDQLSSAFGGINYIQMSRFPDASVSPIQIPNSVWWELEKRISLVYIGSPHNSSDVHKTVIADLGANAEQDPRLVRLRLLAGRAKDALYSADFEAFGEAMKDNTEVQRHLHKALVCERFEELIELARDFGSVGWKVNGAGGDGGSMTILGDGDSAKKRAFLVEAVKRGYATIPIYLSRYGLRVW
jgi:D-glycero-alpha-D-manno-heptose-7-phosphate kinase